MKHSLLFLANSAMLAMCSPLQTMKANEPEDKFAASLYIEKPIDPTKAAVPEGTVTTVKYGPYPIKANSMNTYIQRWRLNIQKPCEDCYITAMQADLHDAAGNTINIDTGAWLHHIVIFNGLGFTPGSKQDVICSQTLQSLYMGYPNRIFASGNERAPIRMNGKHKYGLPVDKGDQFHSSIELVNQMNQDRDFYIVMHYEWVPKTTPEYKPAKMLWMDITGCGSSEAPGKEGNYEYKSPGWKSNIEGALLFTMGHTHDGGAYTTIYINDKPVCRSEQMYGTKPAYYEPAAAPGAAPMAGGHSHGRMIDGPSGPDSLHISEVTACTEFGILRKGDNVVIGASYNTSVHALNPSHPGHESKGKFAPVMGINPVYVAEGLMTL